MDYKLLFEKYMALVEYHSGSCHVQRINDDLSGSEEAKQLPVFSQEEVTELERISRG